MWLITHQKDSERYLFKSVYDWQQFVDKWGWKNYTVQFIQVM